MNHDDIGRKAMAGFRKALGAGDRNAMIGRAMDEIDGIAIDAIRSLASKLVVGGVDADEVKSLEDQSLENYARSRRALELSVESFIDDCLN